MKALRGLLALAGAALLIWACGGSAYADTSVTAHLRSQNSSGARGTATLTATNDGRLVVVIHAHGLVPNQPHAQHLHGSFGGKHYMCASMADDTNGDGILTNEEATGEYGSIYFSLTTSGDASANSGLATDRMPVADSSGHIDYRRTFSAQQVPDVLLKHLSEMHVVQHGIDVNNNGRYDMSGLGVSTFARSLGVKGVPEEATDPATCGVVTGAGAPVAPSGGVDTGGDPAGPVNVSLAAMGGLLLGSSVAVLLLRRPRRRLLSR